MNAARGGFLARPGGDGVFGAVMDEYARAAEDYCRVVEGFSAERFVAERHSEDPSTRSPRTICLHVCSAARRYADYVRKAMGLPYVDRFELEPSLVTTAGEVRAHLRDAIRYTEDTVGASAARTTRRSRRSRSPCAGGPATTPR